VSVGLSNDKVLVAVNQSQDPNHPAPPPNYTSFRVGPQGQLTAIPSSTISIDPGSSSQALISMGACFPKELGGRPWEVPQRKNP
jgi:hypothetical protein